MSYFPNNSGFPLILILKIFLLLVPLLNCLNNNISYIIIPFYSKNENKSIITNYYYNDIYSKIDIGSNHQQIEMILKLNNFPLYLVEKKSVSKNFKPYLPENSNTYVSNSNSFFYDRDFISGTTSYDLFIINSTKIQINLKFILADKMSHFSIIPPGSIGFSLSPSSSNTEKNINFI